MPKVVLIGARRPLALRVSAPTHKPAATCNNLCPAEDATECVAGQLRTCTVDANGCLDWSAQVACADGFCADTTSCGVCNHECAQVGDACNADGVTLETVRTRLQWLSRVRHSYLRQWVRKRRLHNLIATGIAAGQGHACRFSTPVLCSAGGMTTTGSSETVAMTPTTGWLASGRQ